MKKSKVLPVILALVLALGCISAFAFAEGESNASNTAYLATGTNSSVQVDQLYNVEIEETKTDITKVQVSWELEKISASVTINKIWDTTELKWVDDTSSPNTATATDVTAEFNFKNLSSREVDAKVTFETEDGFSAETEFTDDGITDGDGIITLGTKAGGKTINIDGKIEISVTPNAGDFETFTSKANDAKYGTYTATIFNPKDHTPNYLKFTATADDSSVTPKFSSGTWQYSTDNGETWTEGDNIGTKINLNSGQSLLLRGKNCTTGFNEHFSMTGKISASGSVTSLTDGNGSYTKVDLTKLCYIWMFASCKSLTSAPELSATVLADYCYSKMFYNCSSLTSAPELPATVLADYCYDDMFHGCSSLTSAPELPATVLADFCYHYMFILCSSLTTAPLLPAKILTSACYEAMFYGCKSLCISNSASDDATAFFVCPSYGGLFSDPVSSMFIGTGGDFTDEPVANNTYYWVASN